jgi:hypothetical protein
VKWTQIFGRQYEDHAEAINEHFPDYETIKPLAKHYKSNTNDLSLELRQMKRMIERETSEKTMPDAF